MVYLYTLMPDIFFLPLLLVHCIFWGISSSLIEWVESWLLSSGFRVRGVYLGCNSCDSW